VGEASDESKSNTFLIAVVGLAVVAALSGGAYVYLDYQSDKLLDERAEAAREAVADWKARSRLDRAPLPALGEPRQGNAVDHYQVLTWVLGPYEGMPKPAAETALARGAEWDTTVLGDLEQAVKVGGEAGPKAEAFATEFAELAEHIRQGARSTWVDWEFPVEQGLLAKLPSLLALRGAALILAHQALRADDPQAAARDGLAIVVLGHDLAQLPDLLGRAIGRSLVETGCRSLARTLGREDCDAATCRLVLEAAAALPEFPVLTSGQQKLWIEVSMAQIGGRWPEAPIETEDLSSLSHVQVELWDLNLARESSHLDEFYKASQAEDEKPYVEARASHGALVEALEQTDSQLVSVMFVDQLRIRGNLMSAWVLQDMVRVHAAARLRWIEDAAYPADQATLAELLGGALPVDPFVEGAPPLGYAVDGARLLLTSPGPDGEAGTDDDLELACGPLPGEQE
jgi:hypothetical protein